MRVDDEMTMDGEDMSLEADNMEDDGLVDKEARQLEEEAEEMRRRLRSLRSRETGLGQDSQDLRRLRIRQICLPEQRGWIMV